MIDVVNAGVSLLLAGSGVSALVGTRVSGDEVAEDWVQGIESAVGVVVSNEGSVINAQSPTVEVTLGLRAYGATPTGARAVLAAVHGDVHGQKKRTVGGVTWLGTWMDEAADGGRDEATGWYVAEATMGGVALTG